uniref:F-box domain-containing protein n=1 Tax=Panagrellus redivivus TaxID=6233 RepID=A0A7E4VWX6_PANRE
MVELSSPPNLAGLLPDVLAALCDHFTQVECEMVPCPDLSRSPHFLGVASPEQVHLVPELAVVEPRAFLPGSKQLGTAGIYSILATESSPAMLTLRVTLHANKDKPMPNWHSFLKARLSRFLSTLTEFLVIEASGLKSRIHLIQYGSSPEPPAITPLTTNLWLIPVAKVHLPDTSKSNSPENGEKKVVKKKIVKRVIKKKVPASATTPESSKTPEEASPAPATNGVNGVNGKKEGSPEVVQEVVEDVSSVSYLVKLGLVPAEDGVSLKDIKEPAGDGLKTNGTTLPSINGGSLLNGSRSSLTNGENGSVNGNGNGIDKPVIEPLKLNGSAENGKTDLSKVNGSLENGPTGRFKLNGTVENNITTTNGTNHVNGSSTTSDTTRKVNGINGNTTDDEENDALGPLSPLADNNTLSSSNGTFDVLKSASDINSMLEKLIGQANDIHNHSRKHSDTPESDEGTPKRDFVKEGSILSTARKFDDTVNGAIPDDKPFSSNSDTVSPLSDISTTAPDDIPKSPLSPVIKINDTRADSDDDTISSFYSARSRSTPVAARMTSESPTTQIPPPSAPPGTAGTSVLSGFLSNFTSSLSSTFGRGTSPVGTSRLAPMASESNLPSRLSGLSSLRHSDSLRSLNSSSSTLANRRRSTSAARSTLPPVPEQPVVNLVRGMPQMPVIVLQAVLKTLSYREIAEFRRVHPHWDEICGQMLNSGYYILINKADRLLQDCQRRVHNERELQTAITALTNMQVHVLNPVDMLRAPMDEGVLCFPYGQLLDKSFALLDMIERVVVGTDDAETAVLPWQRLAELARRAQTHYRQFVEPEVEKRMGEVARLQATARLQRIDSFLVESSVSKLERDTEQAKHDLQWEIEQLKTQNQQLKKDNRELKQGHAKLEGRIEALERKFKTVARLLQ